jgi:aspartate racemase
VEYYRTIIELYRAARPQGGYPHLVVDSVDLDRLVELVTSGRLDELAAFVSAAVGRLAAAGCDLALVASNTPHLVFDAVRRRARIPLISIVEAARDAARARGLTRVALLGTRFTMEARFYPDVFATAGIALTVPSADERGWIHGKYMDELILGRFEPDTRAEMAALIDRLVARDGVQGVILGGTELPLLLREVSTPRAPLLDTGRIHAERAVAEMLRA